jgi:hypothetical protein
MSNTSDNDNDSNDKKKIRRNKKLLFDNERNKILNDLINFINNSKDGEYIFVVDLQQNKQLIKYIIDNVDNIKKWYRCSSWGYFVSENNNQQGDEITLLKSILKDHGYNIYRKDITADKYNEKKRYTTIKLIKD